MRKLTFEMLCPKDNITPEVLGRAPRARNALIPALRHTSPTAVPFSLSHSWACRSCGCPGADHRSRTVAMPKRASKRSLIFLGCREPMQVLHYSSRMHFPFPRSSLLRPRLEGTSLRQVFRQSCTPSCSLISPRRCLVSRRGNQPRQLGPWR